MSAIEKMVEYAESWIDSGVEYSRGQIIECMVHKARSLLAEEAARKPTAPSKHYKCPKCHTRFTREYPYMPSSTKEVMPTADKGLREAIQKVIDEHELTANTKAQQILAGICQALDDNPATPTSSIAEEPLAVLADRKGWEIAQLKHLSPFPNVWEICLRPKGGQRGEWVGENWPDFDTYAEAESKARAYLEGLPDKREE